MTLKRELFPDAPLTGWEPYFGQKWNGNAGKPFTLAEKRAILGDAYMASWPVNNLKPLKHEPAVHVISRTVDNGKTVERVAIRSGK